MGHLYHGDGFQREHLSLIGGKVRGSHMLGLTVTALVLRGTHILRLPPWLNPNHGLVGSSAFRKDLQDGMLHTLLGKLGR